MKYTIQIPRNTRIRLDDGRWRYIATFVVGKQTQDFTSAKEAAKWMDERVKSILNDGDEWNEPDARDTLPRFQQNDIVAPKITGVD